MRKILLLAYMLNVIFQISYGQDSSAVVSVNYGRDHDSSILSQVLRGAKNSNFQTITPIKKDQILNLAAIEVSFDMTTHLIFPYEIIYVDLGSPDIISQKVDKVGNVLKMKANKRSFSPTTMTVITADGQFFSFMVSYNDYPKVLNINMFKHNLVGIGDNIVTNKFPAVAQHDNPGEGIGLIENVNMNKGELDRYSNIAIKKKRKIYHIGEEKYHMDVSVNNIFIKDNVFFLCFSFENHSQVDYDIDFIKFFVRDKKLLKRTAQQELELSPIHVFDPLNENTVMGNGTVNKILCLQKFTVFDDKEVYVEIFEKNGGRSFVFNLTNEDLIRAKKI